MSKRYHIRQVECRVEGCREKPCKTSPVGLCMTHEIADIDQSLCDAGLIKIRRWSLHQR